jgi:hypothetical protein
MSSFNNTLYIIFSFITNKESSSNLQAINISFNNYTPIKLVDYFNYLITPEDNIPIYINYYNINY